MHIHGIEATPSLNVKCHKAALRGVIKMLKKVTRISFKHGKANVSPVCSLSLMIEPF